MNQVNFNLKKVVLEKCVSQVPQRKPTNYFEKEVLGNNISKNKEGNKQKPSAFSKGNENVTRLAKKSSSVKIEEIDIKAEVEDEENEKNEVLKKILLEDIKEFHLETEEHLLRAGKVVIPPIEEIEGFLLDLPHVENLMKAEGKKLCVWDLDETLIHAELEDPEIAQVKLQIQLSKKKSKPVNTSNINYIIIFNI